MADGQAGATGGSGNVGTSGKQAGLEAGGKAGAGAREHMIGGQSVGDYVAGTNKDVTGGRQRLHEKATGLFSGLHLLLVEGGVQKARLEVWRKKLPQLGGSLAKHLAPGVTHVVAASWDRVVERCGDRRARKLRPVVVKYEWIEESLKTGELPPVASYQLKPPTSCQVSPFESPRKSAESLTESLSGSPARSPVSWGTASPIRSPPRIFPPEDVSGSPDGQGKLLSHGTGSPAGGENFLASPVRSGTLGEVAEDRGGKNEPGHRSDTLTGISGQESFPSGRGKLSPQAEEHAREQPDWMSVIRDSARAGAVVHGKRQRDEVAAKASAKRQTLSSLLEPNVGPRDESRGEGSGDGEGRSRSSHREAGSPEKEAWVAESSPATAGYTPPDLNPHITGPFSELKGIYSALGDDMRYFTYYKALSVIEKLPFRVTEVSQVKGLPTIGASLRNQIDEILRTGKLQRLERLEHDERVAPLILLGSVWGIGPHSAQRLYKMGYRTLEELAHEPSLTPAQRIALQFHEDINAKIPRHEVAVMEDIVKKVAEELRPGISVVCGGSYRRGKALVGDMDFVITHPDGRSHRGLLPLLVERLKGLDFVTEDLMVGPVHSAEGTDRGVDTYFGLCRYPGRARRHRIDFKVYPLDQYPYGLIAWTGNDVLNRRLRTLADSQGYKLDDHGLYPVARDRYGERIIRSDHSVPLKSEREVFDFLGFPWMEPHERNL